LVLSHEGRRGQNGTEHVPMCPCLERPRPSAHRTCEARRDVEVPHFMKYLGQLATLDRCTTHTGAGATQTPGPCPAPGKCFPFSRNAAGNISDLARCAENKSAHFETSRKNISKQNHKLREAILFFVFFKKTCRWRNRGGGGKPKPGGGGVRRPEGFRGGG
jgi:hypothetical protein